MKLYGRPGSLSALYTLEDKKYQLPEDVSSLNSIDSVETFLDEICKTPKNRQANAVKLGAKGELLLVGGLANAFKNYESYIILDKQILHESIKDKHYRKPDVILVSDSGISVIDSKYWNYNHESDEYHKSLVYARSQIGESTSAIDDIISNNLDLESANVVPILYDAKNTFLQSDLINEKLTIMVARTIQDIINYISTHGRSFSVEQMIKIKDRILSIPNYVSEYDAEAPISFSNVSGFSDSVDDFFEFFPTLKEINNWSKN